MPEQQAQDPRPQKPEEGRRRRRELFDKFTIELVAPNCGSVPLNVFRRRLRSRWSITTLHSRKGGYRDIGKMNAMPDIPGIRVTVHGDGKVTIFDPLNEDTRKMDELKEQIVAVYNQASVAQMARVKTVDRSEQKCDVDQLKTLLIELSNKVNGEPKYAEVTDGELPSMDAIEAMPGRQLHDPWNSNQRRPKYKDDVEAYEIELERLQQ